MSSVFKTDNHNVQDINTTATDTTEFDNKFKRSGFFNQLKQREQEWWQAHQRLSTLKERKLFWFGENSLMMWLLWQFVAYVVVATGLMFLSSTLNWSLPLWQYMAFFVVQTLIFIVMYAFRGRLAERLQYKIGKADLEREEALHEMTILASDSLFIEVHEKSPISLQQVYEHYDAQYRLVSLHRLLQQEVDSGRLMLSQQQEEARILPPKLADADLVDHASAMIYKSVL